MYSLWHIQRGKKGGGGVEGVRAVDRDMGEWGLTNNLCCYSSWGGKWWKTWFPGGGLDRDMLG